MRLARCGEVNASGPERQLADTGGVRAAHSPLITGLDPAEIDLLIAEQGRVTLRLGKHLAAPLGMISLFWPKLQTGWDPGQRAGRPDVGAKGDARKDPR